MLSNYLIFLCIGVYASCKPILNDNELKKRQASIWEIQKDFCAIEQELYTLHKSNEVQLHIPKDLSKEACARFNLNTYIKLLNQSSVMENVTTHYNMLQRLDSLAREWPAEDLKDQNCTATPESNRNLQHSLHRFLLHALPTFVGLSRTTCHIDNVLKMFEELHN